jgi:hypothetical protein
MSLLDDLLAKGYFPVQLPPGFTSATFASLRAAYEPKWAAVGKIEPTSGERFSVARSSYYRRSTAILNPIGFYHLAKEVDAYWPQIKAHYAKSQLSRSIPSEGGSLRAIELTKFSELHEDKITSSSGFKYALITDVSSFFPAIYTHTVPWALHGKKEAKKHRTNYSATYFGNLLDKHSMLVQDGQTIGLPIGPDTSHIIAEVIGVAIDLALEKALGGWPSGFRYVDDFYLFFSRREDAERALAAVVRAVGDYELQINPAKTRIVEVREIAEESWKYSVKKLRLRPGRRAQRDDIHHYFETLFSLERRFKDESIVKYGLKQLASTIVKKSNWTLFEAYLLKCGYGFPNTMQTLAHFLATYKNYGYSIDMVAVRRFCGNQIVSSAASDHHSEVAWLLWICKELDLDLDKAIVEDAAKMGNAACTLLLLDLHYSQVLTPGVPVSLLTPVAKVEELMSKSWLLAYEGGRRQWLGNADVTYIKTHPFFGPLLDAGVQFYDEEVRLPPMFTLKTEDESFDFDSDEDIESEFDFDEMDEEYFDADDEKDEDPDEEKGDEGEEEGDDKAVSPDYSDDL